jgi:hypothetical protein
LQILTVAELLAGKTIDYPATGPGIRHERPPEQLTLPDAPPEERTPPVPRVEAAQPASRPRQEVPELVDELLERAQITRPPIRLEPILEQLGMQLSADPRMREDALLVPMTDPTRGPVSAWTVYYNPGKPETRRRFTLAHEVGHVVLHGEPFAAAARGPTGGGRLKAREREVQRFAAALLLPERMVRQAVHEYGLDIERLRSLFLVSKEAMEIRLRELGLG